MLYKKLDDGYLVRLVRGEEIRTALSKLMREQQIGCGAVTGLGAVRDPHLGCYVLEEKRYIERRWEGHYELAGLTGSLSWFEGQPFPHVHVVLADPEFSTLGGHLFEAVTTATLEMRVLANPERVDRQVDDEIGLHLMQLPESCPLR